MTKSKKSSEYQKIVGIIFILIVILLAYKIGLFSNEYKKITRQYICDDEFQISVTKIKLDGRVMYLNGIDIKSGIPLKFKRTDAWYRNFEKVAIGDTIIKEKGKSYYTVFHNGKFTIIGVE